MGLRDWLNREMFHPSVASFFINPFFFARWGLIVQMREFAPQLSGGKLIDIGCGRKPYRELFPETDYVGIEIDTPATRARGIAERFYDGNTFPCSDAEFDAALANQVLEHVFEPEAFLAEIHRVLKPGGKLLCTVPFIWDEHEQPYDYARYSSFGIRYLLEKQGFTVLEARKTISNFGAVAQLVNAYFYKALLSRSGILKILGTLLIVFPMNLFGLLISLLLPQNSDLYLDNIVLAEKRP